MKDLVISNTIVTGNDQMYNAWGEITMGNFNIANCYLYSIV
jgi:hypothetical protein